MSSNQGCKNKKRLFRCFPADCGWRIFFFAQSNKFLFYYPLTARNSPLNEKILLIIYNVYNNKT